MKHVVTYHEDDHDGDHDHDHDYDYHDFNTPNTTIKKATFATSKSTDKRSIPTLQIRQKGK